MTNIWWEQPSDINDLSARASLLSADERERIRHLRRASDRANAIAAWSLVRLKLGEACQSDPRFLRFERKCPACGLSDHGKPRLANPREEWHFSLSHSAEKVVVAISPTGPVGVDVEAASRSIDDIQGAIQHPSEPPCSGIDLLRVWTRKEAFLKATGEGLRRPMAEVNLAEEASGFRVYDLECDEGYVGAVTTIDGPPDGEPTRLQQGHGRGSQGYAPRTAIPPKLRCFDLDTRTPVSRVD